MQLTMRLIIHLSLLPNPSLWPLSLLSLPHFSSVLLVAQSNRIMGYNIATDDTSCFTSLLSLFFSLVLLLFLSLPTFESVRESGGVEERKIWYYTATNNSLCFTHLFSFFHLLLLVFLFLLSLYPPSSQSLTQEEEERMEEEGTMHNFPFFFFLYISILFHTYSLSFCFSQSVSHEARKKKIGDTVRLIIDLSARQ